MNCINPLITGSQAFTQVLRITLRPSSALRLQPCLRDRWSFAASLEPPSRNFARLLPQLGLGLGARTFS